MDMNILVTLDAGYLDPLRVMMHSMHKSNPMHTFHIYVMHTSLQPAHFDLLRATVPAEQFDIIDFAIDPEMFADMPYSQRFPKEACFRIFAAQLLPKQLDRILYLDPDIVVINDLEPLYRMDLQDYYFAAATHMALFLQLFNQTRLHMPYTKSKYINSGVLLLNLTRLREKQNQDRVYRFLEHNRFRIWLFDQDMLNFLYHKQTLILDPLRYNLDEKYFNWHQMRPWRHNKENIRWVKQNTVIIHFCGRNKPWNDNYLGVFDELFYFPYAKELGLERLPRQEGTWKHINN